MILVHFVEHVTYFAVWNRNMKHVEEIVNWSIAKASERKEQRKNVVHYLGTAYDAFTHLVMASAIMRYLMQQGEYLAMAATIMCFAASFLHYAK